MYFSSNFLWTQVRIRNEEERLKERAKQDEERRRESKRAKEEDLAVCYVCSSGDHSAEDAIVFCERCCVAVHTSCYDAQGVSDPTGIPLAHYSCGAL